MGSPGSACAQVLGSLAARAPTLGTLPPLAPSFLGFVQCRSMYAASQSRRYLQTCLPPGPVSPGATWEHGHLQQLVVVGGRYLPAMWAPGLEDRIDQLLSLSLSLCWTVLRSRPYPGTA